MAGQCVSFMGIMQLISELSVFILKDVIIMNFFVYIYEDFPLMIECLILVK